MATHTMRTTAVISMLAALALGSAACSSKKAVDKNDVANAVGSKISETIGHKPESVTCPQDLSASVGATLDCQVKDGGQTTTANVKVTSVEGDTTHYDIHFVAFSKDEVTSHITEWYTGQFGGQPTSVSCPSGVLGAAGLTVTCQVTDSTGTGSVQLKVTGVDGTNIKYDVTQQ